MITAKEIEQAVPEVRVCNIEEQFTKSKMLPRIIIDFLYKERLRTHFIYLDVNKVDDKDYILDKVAESIRNYIVWFDKNLIYR